MKVNVAALNDVPTASNRTISTNEDTAKTLTTADFGFADSDVGDTLAVTISSLPATGRLMLNGVAVTQNQIVAAAEISQGQLIFTPAENANGNALASFGFKVSDGTQESAALYTMTVNVTAANDAPTASNRTITTIQDTANKLALTDFGFTDVDTGNTLRAVTITSTPAAGSLKFNGTAIAVNQVVTAADITQGKRLFTPATNAIGDSYAAFNFKVSDGTALSTSSYTMTVNVTPINHAPTASNRIISTNEDTPRALDATDFGFADNDAGNALQAVTITSLPTAGNLRLNGVAVSANQIITAADINLGNLIFTPAANAYKDAYAAFSFKVSDGAILSTSSYKMTVNVTAVNDAPTATNRTISTNEDTPRTLATTDFGFSDIDVGNTLQAITISSLPASGSLKLAGTPVTAN